MEMSTEFMELLLSNRKEYSAHKRACKRLDKLEKAKGRYEHLLARRDELQSVLTEQLDQVGNYMMGLEFDGYRGLRLSQDWYAFLVVKDNITDVPHVTILPVPDEKVEALESRMVNGYVSEHRLRTVHLGMETCHQLVERYSESVNARANEIVSSIDNKPGRGRITVSNHAGMRWAQRVMGISSTHQATSYFEERRDELAPVIITAFNNSELLWVNPEDNTEYYIDGSNTLFVFNSNEDHSNVIITLYEVDFGFSKQINKTIALAQIGVITEAYMSLLDTEHLQEMSKAHITAAVDEVDQRIAEATELLKSLKEERATYVADIEYADKMIRTARHVYSAEYNKVFKKTKE